MGRNKVIKCLVIGLATLTMLMGTGCALFTALPGIDSADTPPETDSANTPPEISSLDPSATSVELEGSCTIVCVASDADGDPLTYDWTATGGTITGQGSTITWMAPVAEGSYTITASVSDGKGVTKSDTCTISVANTPPEISSLDPSATSVELEGSCTVTCVASDADDNTLTYDWTATGGTITGEGSTITWMAPAAEGSYTITVTVSDGKGGTASDSCTVVAEMRFGSIDIQSNPDEAAVYLNGEDTGNITPYTMTNLEAGDYTIKLVLYHHEYREATVTVNDDETTYINWSLTQAPEQMVAIQPNAANGKDSSIDTAMQDQNYGTRDEVAAGTGSADTVRAFLQFDLDSIPEDAVIINADLGLHYYRSVGGIVTAPIGAYAVLENWNEGSLTWNNQPDFSTTVEYTRTVPASITNGFVYWSLDDLVEAWVDSTMSNYGLVLKDTDESTVEVWKGFHSSDWGTASERPKLVVHYYDPTP